MVMPVLNYSAEQKGICVRFLEPNAKQKYDLQLDDDWYRLHYPVSNRKHTKLRHRHALVLVEDIPSAVRVSLKAPAAALLGTHLTERAALDIRQRYDKLVIALDPDRETNPSDH